MTDTPEPGATSGMTVTEAERRIGAILQELEDTLHVRVMGIEIEDGQRHIVIGGSDPREPMPRRVLVCTVPKHSRWRA